MRLYEATGVPKVSPGIGAALSIYGVSGSSSASRADIAAGSDDTILRRTASALSFGALTTGMFPATVVPDAALSANVPLKDTDATISATYTFTQTLSGAAQAPALLQSATPGVILDNTGAAADTGVWRLYADTTTLRAGLVDDAGGAAADFLQVQRTTTSFDFLSLLVGSGNEAIRFTLDGTDAIQRVNANVGLTADVGSAQGNGVITSSFNVYSTVGTAGDAATLPATFGVGTLVYVKNDAATNSMDVFPASGDDAGAGTDTAVAVAAGDFAIFMATAVDATWTKIAGGTA